jgi:hypothetical protein
MKTERICPDCATAFTAVADYCVCPNCNRRFYASDPSRPAEFRMPEEFSFHATTVGTLDEDGILHICFDDAADNYLLLTRVDDDHLQEFDDRGDVYVEVNSQLIGSANGFQSVILEPGRLSIRFLDSQVMKGLLSLCVDFEVPDRFHDLTEHFAVLMRGKTQYTYIPPNA